MINFTAARFGDQRPEVAFGTTERKKETFLGFSGPDDPDAPGPGQYDTDMASDARNIRLYMTERALGDRKLPNVLREDIGPGARNALRVLAERRAAERLIGPQSYQRQPNAPTRRSFNALAAENQIH